LMSLRTFRKRAHRPKPGIQTSASENIFDKGSHRKRNRIRHGALTPNKRTFVLLL
jgi:hypothetical protein